VDESISLADQRWLFLAPGRQVTVQACADRRLGGDLIHTTGCAWGLPEADGIIAPEFLPGAAAVAFWASFRYVVRLFSPTWLTAARECFPGAKTPLQ